MVLVMNIASYTGDLSLTIFELLDFFSFLLLLGAAICDGNEALVLTSHSTCLFPRSLAQQELTEGPVCSGSHSRYLGIHKNKNRQDHRQTYILVKEGRW